MATAQSGKCTPVGTLAYRPPAYRPARRPASSSSCWRCRWPRSVNMGPHGGDAIWPLIVSFRPVACTHHDDVHESRHRDEATMEIHPTETTLIPTVAHGPW